MILNGSSCPHDVKEVSCFSDPCRVSSCPNHPNSVCVSSSCGQMFYYNSYSVYVFAVNTLHT